MLANAGVSTAGRANEILMVNKGDNGRAGTGNDNFANGVMTIDNAISKGNPIIVGVDYKNGSPNADGMTDHFVVVVSKTTSFNGKSDSSYYNFYDPGTQYPLWGTSNTNTLNVYGTRIIGSYNNGQHNYTVITVRTNK